MRMWIIGLSALALLSACGEATDAQTAEDAKPEGEGGEVVGDEATGDEATGDEAIGGDESLPPAADWRRDVGLVPPDDPALPF